MKPYDVEAAKREVIEAGERIASTLQARVAQATEEAIAKLEIQARTFADLPKDLGTLYRDASNAIFAEIDLLGMFPPGYSFHASPQVQLDVRIDGYSPRMNTLVATIPAKKHRMIVFFVPIE